MPRRPRDVARQRIPSTALTASVARYKGGAVKSHYKPSQQWQAECYRHYSICGEARFAAQFHGSALSRATLGVAKISKGKPKRLASGKSFDALEALFNGEEGQAEMLKAIGVHFTIAGECYLVGRSVSGEDGDEDIWEILSVNEVKVKGRTWSVDYGDNSKPIELSDDDVVIRLWRPHPSKKVEADSPFRSLLPILNEIEWLTRYVFAQATSRLVGAGLLLVDQDITFPPPPAQEGQEITYANDAEALMGWLGNIMMEAIEDPSNPAAKVPGVIQMPGEAIDKVKLLQFWSELDANAKDLRQEAIQRFALGMDLPPERILGMSSNLGTGGGNSNGVSHWGAWQVDEDTIKMHTEPMLDVIVNSLTIGYLRPLTEEGDVRIIHDTSALRLRPDRSKEAAEWYDRGGISLTAALRENGFDPEDVMSPEEYKTWLLRKVATGSATPEMVAGALAELGVDLQVPDLGDIPNESRPPPSLEDHPTRPRTPAESALFAACNALVYRALERAGNRLKNKGVRPIGVPSHETHLYVRSTDHSVLDDAWACAPQILDGIADPEVVEPILDAYAMSLISTGTKHEPNLLTQWLSKGEEAS